MWLAYRKAILAKDNVVKRKWHGMHGDEKRAYRILTKDNAVKIKWHGMVMRNVLAELHHLFSVVLWLNMFGV